MAPIDPAQLLKALGPLLTNNGGIKGAQEASRLVSLMKNAKKLVNKCIYLSILRVTESQDALEKFISMGGWDTLNTWLDLARGDSNQPLVGELLEVYLNIPVTVLLLKQNSAAKTIKQLSKSENERIKTLSAQLVERWTKTIRGQNNASSELDVEEKKKKKKHKEKEKDKDKDKEKEKDRSKEKDRDRKDRDEREGEKHKNRDKDHKDSKNYKHQKDKEKDRKDRDRHKEKDKERDKAKRDKSKQTVDNKEVGATKMLPSSDNVLASKASNTKDSTASRKLSSEEVTTASSISSSSLSSAASLFLSASNDHNLESSQAKEEESRRRPKTVKQFGARFRSTGLFDEDDEDLEPMKKKVDKPPLKRTSQDRLEEIGDKKSRLQLTMPAISTGSGDPGAATTPEYTHGRIKIIPPKRPPTHEIHDSNVFMDALQQSTYTHGVLKRKKKNISPSSSNTTPPLLLQGTLPSGASPPSHSSPPGQGEETGPMSPPLLSPTTAMAQRLPSVPSFYRDTLDDLPESTETQSKDTNNKDDDSIPPPLESMVMAVAKDEEMKENEEEEQMDISESDASVPGTRVDLDLEPKSDFIRVEPEEERPNPDIFKKPRKVVSWAADTVLEEVFYFEMDETERENVNRPKTFSEMKKEEMILDKRAMESAKNFVNDNMVEVLQWKLPKMIDNVIVVVETGCNSKERMIQLEREKVVLCALFFNKVPDTPIEPDPDIPGEQADTKIIPLEDENGSCTEYEHTYAQNDPSSLPYDPEFDLPLQGHVAPMNQGGSVNNNNSGGGHMVHMNNNMNVINMPPALNHLLNTLQQQAQETRDPIMANLQGMLANVLQNTNPQDSNLLMDRILNALEPFRNQIPGLGNLINSVTNNGMENMGGGRGYMGPGPMSGPRHGLLGPHPPGFNMMGGGSMRPPPSMPGPGPMMGAGGGNASGGMNPGYYRGPGPNMDNMRMGGPHQNQWRGGGGGRRGGKRGRSQVCQHFINKGCKYGESCIFLHPANS